jgi:MFS family permease
VTTSPSPPSRAAAGFVREWWSRTTAGLPRPFWFIFAGTIVNRVGQFVQPFLALYLVRGRDLSVTTVGVVIACYGAGSLISQPLGGWLADRVGRRQTMVIGLVASAVALGVLGVSRPVWALGASAILVGLAMDIYRPAASAAVADLVSPAARPRAFALVYWAINLGVSVSGVLGGFLAERGWWLLFVLDALTCLAFAALIARGVPDVASAHPEHDSGGYGPVLRDRLAVMLSALTLVSACVYIQAYVTLPLAIARDGLPPSAYGIAYAVNPIAIIAIQPLTLGWLSARPPVTVFAASIAVLGAGFGLTGFAHSTVAYAATVFVWTMGEIAFNAVMPTIVNSIAPAHLRGRYNGLIGLAYGASALIGPLAGTAALEAGRWVVWGGCFAVSFAVAAAALAVAPAIGARMGADEVSAAER